jgi:hypothetical protein
MDERFTARHKQELEELLRTHTSSKAKRQDARNEPINDTLFRPHEVLPSASGEMAVWKQELTDKVVSTPMAANNMLGYRAKSNYTDDSLSHDDLQLMERHEVRNNTIGKFE